MQVMSADLDMDGVRDLVVVVSNSEGNSFELRVYRATTSVLDLDGFITYIEVKQADDSRLVSKTSLPAIFHEFNNTENRLQYFIIFEDQNSKRTVASWNLKTSKIASRDFSELVS